MVKKYLVHAHNVSELLINQVQRNADKEAMINVMETSTAYITYHQSQTSQISYTGQTLTFSF